jgi:hypothetical protein
MAKQYYEFMKQPKPCLDIKTKTACESYRESRRDGTSFKKCTWMPKGTQSTDGRSSLLKDSCVGIHGRFRG